MKLNYDKCINLTVNRTQSSIKYKNRNLVPRETKATYLGSIFNDTIDNGMEIDNRMADCIVTANKLKLFWNQANTSKKWKLTVYNAIIKSKLLYGLETIELTRPEQLRIDAFQMRGIRRIMNATPTHIDRTQTNSLILKQATEIFGKPIIRFTTSWKKAKMALLGHILRASHKDPLRQVIFEKDQTKPREIWTRRAGRPRQDWVINTMQMAYDIIMDFNPLNTFDITNQDQIDALLLEATSRQTVFKTNPNKKKMTELFKLGYIPEPYAPQIHLFDNDSDTETEILHNAQKRATFERYMETKRENADPPQ